MFALPLDVIGRLCFAIMAIPGHILYYEDGKRQGVVNRRTRGCGGQGGRSELLDEYSLLAQNLNMIVLTFLRKVWRQDIV